MLFNSLHFLVFFPLMVGLYYALPARWRAPLLLLSSYYFYFSWRPEYTLLLLATTLLDYYSGVRMSRLATQAQRRPWLYLSLASNLGTLFIFKYFNFFRDTAGALATALHLPYAVPALELVLPVGVSFYTFQSVAYIVDVYQGKLEAEPKLGRFALFVAFWPQLVAGPIERGGQMLPQLRQTHEFDYDNVATGLRLMAWGMFKKVVIADRLALLANPVFNHPRQFDSLALVLAVAAFTGQIYADFSGYTDLARGAARVLGFRLVLNFRQPYLATSVGYFWRRWHMSLSNWFRDYVYIPLGGSRRSPARNYGNVLIVFLLSGLWHGASWTFVVWGALHGGYLVVENWSAPLRARLAQASGLAARPRLHRALATATTVALVAYAWIFFRANTLPDAFYITVHLFRGWGHLHLPQLQALLAGLGRHFVAELVVAGGAVALLAAADYRAERGPVSAWLARWAAPLRWAGYLGLLLGTAALLGGLGIWAGLRRGYVDAFYARFASPPAASLVLGTSRAAQGIKPGVLAAQLGGRYEGPWLNYAFTLAESPYGPGYLSSIQRKLAPGTRRGLFIVAVDPWSLSLPRKLLSVKSLALPEARSMVSQLASVSQSPNLDYLAHYLHKPFYQLLLNTNPQHVIERLHPNGWLEIALPPPSADTVLLHRRTAEKLATYRSLAASSSLAAVRLQSLWQTISFLQNHGQVVLLRVPTGPQMAALEKEYQPDFDNIMTQLAARQHASYLNYLDQPYPTNDGNHITRQAAAQFSQRLAADIAALGK